MAIPLDEAELIAIFLESFLYGKNPSSSLYHFDITITPPFRYFLYPVLDHVLDSLQQENRRKEQQVFNCCAGSHASLVILGESNRTWANPRETQ